MHNVLSLQVADNINIKSFKTFYTSELVFFDPGELFYKVDTDKYIYVFSYGVACFLNYKENEVEAFLKLLSPYCKNTFPVALREEFDIEINAKENKFGYNKIEIMDPSVEALRLIMLNVSESVALDYYSQQTATILDETYQQTLYLETNGKLDISGKNLKKFIGKTINLKNRITENLYIFDSPPGTWDDEYLFRIDVELKKTFDIHGRYRNIEDELQIIKENLGLFIDIMHQRKSNGLEIVIIVLIMVEVANLFVEKVL